MFNDKRSKRIILVSHCILNQNAKIDRCAHYPGAIKEVLNAILESGVGILQMPCPELMYLGLDRQVDRAGNPTVEEEDTRVALRIASEEGISYCREIAKATVYQIDQYQQNGFEIVGILGINGSPTCGVETTWYDGQEEDSPGILIRTLREKLHQEDRSIQMRGIKAYEPQEALKTLTDLLKFTDAP
jgi:predicted secreted protein